MERIKPSAIVGFELAGSCGRRYVCRKSDCVGRVRGPEWDRVVKASRALDGKRCYFCNEQLLSDQVALLNGIA